MTGWSSLSWCEFPQTKSIHQRILKRFGCELVLVPVEGPQTKSIHQRILKPTGQPGAAGGGTPQTKSIHQRILKPRLLSIRPRAAAPSNQVDPSEDTETASPATMTHEGLVPQTKSIHQRILKLSMA